MKNCIKIFSLLLFLSFCCYSQEKSRNMMKITDRKIYEMRNLSPKEKKRLKTQIRMNENCEVPLIIEKYSGNGTSKYIPPYIIFALNGKDMQFLFDTGSPISTISDRALKKLGIEVDESIDVPCLTFVRNYRFNGKNMGGFYLEYIPGETYNPDVNGTEIAGTIGLNSVVGTTSFCIDYSRKKLVLNDNPNEYKNLEKIPVSFFSEKKNDMKVKIHITVDGKACSAVLDSGSDHILSCKKIFDLPVKRLEWQRITTSSGTETIKIYYSNAAEIRIGSTVIKNPEIELWDDYALDYFPGWRNAFKFYDVFLGVNGFFDRYKVWVSLDDECLYIKPYDSAPE